MRHCLFACLASFALLAAAEEPQMVRIHWEQGKTYTQETLTETTLQRPEPKAPPQLMKVTQTTTMKVVKEAASANRLVEVKFAAVRGEMGSGKDLMTFDSTKPETSNPMLERAMGRAVGKTFVLVYDEQDRFRETRELGSLASSPGARTGLSALADSRDVANLYRKSLEMGLPPVAVSIGDTWTADETMTFPKAGDMHVAINGKFEAVEMRDGRKHAKISFEGKISSVEKKDKPVADIEISKGSTMGGVIFFDLERRTTSYSSYANHLKMLVAGEELPFEQKITSKMLSIEDNK